ncbi:MAG TPA: tRNA lysidine(34) synthetase TilS [Humisphaera sp.]|jgi:tRNA(Ile)-lysidine synthetase-like protein|nr:tRNA lysidine(34) synthetase TilS [Humisphaera sp.]
MSEIGPELRNAVAGVPAGGWAVGVSGGADSVAVLLLLCERPELRLHVAHLNHQTRGSQNDEEAAFVADLCGKLGIARTVEIRSNIEPAIPRLPANKSARFRAARREFFRRVVTEHKLSGVILAHHADDQAETVLQRLLRGSGPGGLGGMEPTSSVGGVTIFRPLLAVRSRELRDYLVSRNQAWRDDPSNDDPRYSRNRLRKLLAVHPHLADAALRFADACHRLNHWTHASAPKLAESFAVTELAPLPEILAAESARDWLVARGVPPDKMTPDGIARLVRMARDAASPARAQFSGNLRVGRRGGKIFALPADAQTENFAEPTQC